MLKSIETRLQKLESATSGNRFIVIAYGDDGTADGAEAFFEQATGYRVDPNDSLVLIKRFSQSERNAAHQGMALMYDILTALEPGSLNRVMREIDGRSMGLPNKARVFWNAPALL